MSVMWWRWLWRRATFGRMDARKTGHNRYCAGVWRRLHKRRLACKRQMIRVVIYAVVFNLATDDSKRIGRGSSETGAKSLFVVWSFSQRRYWNHETYCGKYIREICENRKCHRVSPVITVFSEIRFRRPWASAGALWEFKLFCFSEFEYSVFITVRSEPSNFEYFIREICCDTTLLKLHQYT